MGSKSQKGKHQEVNFEDSTSVTCQSVKCRRPEIFLLTDQGRLQRTFRIQSILINFKSMTVQSNQRLHCSLEDPALYQSMTLKFVNLCSLIC